MSRRPQGAGLHSAPDDAGAVARQQLARSGKIWPLPPNNGEEFIVVAVVGFLGGATELCSVCPQQLFLGDQRSKLRTFPSRRMLKSFRPSGRGAPMFSEAELAVIRRAYAKQILAAARVNDHRIEAAFANIRREDYLGPGPWPMLRYEVYVPSPDANPVYLYSNILVGIIPERKLNNGEPAFHARLIAAAAPAEGEHVIHVGPGTGYTPRSWPIWLAFRAE
jgi:hypothetical protein